MAVVLTPWPETPSVLEGSNRTTIAALTGVPVDVLPWLPRADFESLADAGAKWPIEEWLDVRERA